MQWLNCSYFLLMKRKFAKVGSKTAPKSVIMQDPDNVSSYHAMADTKPSNVKMEYGWFPLDA